MKLHHLRDFLAIVEKESISAAAKHLGIAQPSLSRSIRELEKELGAPLFERHARGAALTQMGIVFARRARMAMGELEKGRAEISQMQGEVHGDVTVCISGVSHLTLLGESLTPFQKRYPLVKLHLIEGVYPQVESRLREGSIDAYVGPVPDVNIPPDLRVEKLFQPSRVVLARKGHPLAGARSLAELVDANWLTTSITDKAELEFGAIFEAQGLPPPRLSMRVGSSMTLITALTSSDAIVISSRTWADLPMFRDLLTVIEVEQILSAPAIALIYRAAVPPTPAAEYFCDMIRRAAVPMLKRYPPPAI
ncbi:MAG: LysR family transcriptional regulator [Polaromonas sp.]|uniref:LysR family transcriptional regulator n=1 Tax=Polaromonas sp. TaxID=1869339 RepID=UPI0025E4B560|nr:LysR substrate-binding domain-containing protein [Polaromonas sp.]MBI2726985.1 LysR family transcriptional regulator [Polaromonas sp.]